MNFEAMQKEVYETAASKGWWEGDINIPEKLMLVVTEIAEAMEEYRAGTEGTYYDTFGKPEGFAIELADTIIRLMDLSEFLGIDLAAAVFEKNEYNKTREWRHGGKLA